MMKKRKRNRIDRLKERGKEQHPHIHTQSTFDIVYSRLTTTTTTLTLIFRRLRVYVCERWCALVVVNVMVPRAFFETFRSIVHTEITIGVFVRLFLASPSQKWFKLANPLRICRRIIGNEVLWITFTLVWLVFAFLLFSVRSLIPWVCVRVLVT